jgi:hypothetical protein
MITFNELVKQVDAKLAGQRGRRDPISTETIEEILGEAGIAGLMQQAGEGGTAQRLQVRQLWIRGRKWQSHGLEPVEFSYHRTLGPGLNGWVAGNGTGKSTVLKTIVWALTGVEPNFKPDVRTWLEDIAVEVDISGDGLYTIRYSPRPGSQVSGRIFAQPLDSVLSTEEPVGSVESFSGKPAMTEAIDRFFGSRMGFSPLEGLEWKRHTMTLTSQVTSWDVYSQALFISADDYSDYLFPSRSTNGQYHQKTLGAYLDMHLLEALSKAQAEQLRARQDYEFERKRVEVDAARIRDEINRLEDELRHVENRLGRIDAEQTVLLDPAFVHHVREEVSQATERVVALAQQLHDWETEETRLQNDLNQAQRACQALKESIEFKLFLSGLEVEKCPHCEASIPQTRVAEELETGQCRVCGSHLQPVSSVDAQQVLLKKAEERVVDLRKDLRRIRRKHKKVAAKLEQAQQELELHRAEFSDLSRQEREGFTSEMRTLVDAKGYLRGQLERLREQTKEGRGPQLRKLKRRQDVLKAAHAVLQAAISQSHQSVLEILESRTTDTAQTLGVGNLERVFLNHRFDMFVSQSAKTIRFQDMDVGEQLRLKIAFHLSLLSLRTQDDLGRHPNLLIIDAPGSAELDEQRFSAVMGGLVDLTDRMGDRVQILIASTRDKLLDLCGADQMEYKPEGETVF